MEKLYGGLEFGGTKTMCAIGTGIGGALVLDKQITHGVLNLEMGHMFVPHEQFEDSFSGVCVFHGDCLEGIASGHALRQRYGQPAETNTDPAVWNLEASYLAAAVHNIMMTLGPEKIVLGGGLIRHGGLLEQVREAVAKNNNGYMAFPDSGAYIVPSSGDSNGVLGAIQLIARL